MVRADGHVRFANHYYSVEERYTHQEVLILGTGTMLSIYHQGQLIETHARLTDPYRSKQTKQNHLKPWERALGERSSYREAARKLGDAVEQMIVLILERGNGFIDTRQVWGVLSLDKAFTAAEIDAACARALALKRVGYRAVLPFLPRAVKRNTKANDGQKSHRAAAEGVTADQESKKPPRHIRDLSVYTQHVRHGERRGNAHSYDESGDASGQQLAMFSTDQPGDPT